MTPYEQLKALKIATANTLDPQLLFEMNKKARELQQEISYINSIEMQ